MFRCTLQLPTFHTGFVAIFFRRESVSESGHRTSSLSTLRAFEICKAVSPPVSGCSIFAIAFLIFVEPTHEYSSTFNVIQNDNVVVTYTGYALLLMLLLSVGVLMEVIYLLFKHTAYYSPR